MKLIYRILAESTVFVHTILVLIILFGWSVVSLQYVYGAAIIGTALSWLLFRRCILVDVEYFFRNKATGMVRPGQNSFIAYWAERVFGAQAPSDRFITIWGGFFLAVSIVLWCLNTLSLWGIVHMVK